MISLSLRPTAHPRTSQGTWVRSSTASYCCFNLAMGRSPPLRVHSPRLNALLGLAFATPASRKDLSLPRTMTPGPIMQKVRRHPIKGLRPLVGNWFQVLFHSPKRGAFHFSLTVLVTIGRQVVLSLTGWSPRIHTRFLVSGITWGGFRSLQTFSYEAITRYGGTFQTLRLARRFFTPW